MRFLRLLVLSGILWQSVSAAAPTSSPAFNTFARTPVSQETAARIIAALKAGKRTAAMSKYIDTISTVPFSDDIFEITLFGDNNEVVYVSRDGRYIFQADVFYVPDALNITRIRREDLAQLKGLTAEPVPLPGETPVRWPQTVGKKTGDGQFVPLAPALALKEVHGTGRRRLWILTSPDCQRCKALEAQLSALQDITLYRYLYAANQAAYQHSIALWCSADPNNALANYMLYGEKPPLPAAECAGKTGEKLQRILKETGPVKPMHLPQLFFADAYRTEALPGGVGILTDWLNRHDKTSRRQ